MWIEAFVEYLRCDKGYAESTIGTYEQSLKAFELWKNSLDNSISWDKLDKDTVRQWMVEQMDRGMSPRTICRQLSALRTFYKFLLRRQLVAIDPVHTLQGPKKAKPLPYYVRETEMDRLLDDIPFDDSLEGTRDRLMLLVFYSTGIRRGELIGLDWEHVDLAGSTLKVTGKRNKQRIIPFGQELQEAFGQYARRLEAEGSAPKGAVFRGLRSGQRIRPEEVTNTVKRYLAAVTTSPRRSPHVLRHSFATSMLNHHADLQSVKDLLGHESLATTEIYTHTTFEELRLMYNQAHPRA